MAKREYFNYPGNLLVPITLPRMTSLWVTELYSSALMTNWLAS